MRPAALGPALAVLALLAPAAAARPRIAEFGLAVPRPAAHSASARTVVTPVLRPRRRFDLLGLRWRGAGELVGAQVRVAVNGRWRRWVALPSADDHGPDGAPATRGSDPVWAGGAGALQLRWRRAPAGLRLRFVRVTQRPRVAPPARAAQAGGPPPMASRAEWDPADQCRPRAPAAYGSVQIAFVHHTVSANDYTPEQSPAMVLAICRYHRNANGWNDIGYNFLVDRYGRLFEGRAGGIDQPVVGAQAQGFNSQSTSVADLGTYSSVPASDAALQAMASLLAWKLPLHGAPVTGQVVLTSGGGSLNLYPAGQQATFERISGHRDGGRTACPGDALYAQLPRLRELAAAGAGVAARPASVTVAALNGALRYPEPARLVGRLDGAGRVSVQVSVGSRFVPVAHVDPAPDGSWAYELPMTRGHAVRAVQLLPDGSRGVSSPPVRITLTPALSASAPRRVLAGRSVPVRGTLAPAPRALSVGISVQRRDGRWAFVRRAALTVRGGRFGGSPALRRPGLYRLRVSFRGDGSLQPAASDLYVRAVRRASALNGAAAAPAG